MARRTFTQDGNAYSDAPAGWLKAHKDEWDGKIKAKGHNPTWRKSAANTYEATCGNCGGHMTCGTWGSSAHGFNIRDNPCP